MPFDEFRSLVEAMGHEIGQRELAEAFDRLSYGYERCGGRSGVSSRADAAAYAVGRAMATFAVNERILGEVARICPEWRPTTVIDIGAGIASASWAAASSFGSIEHVTVLEGSAEMITLGTEIASRSTRPALRSARWVQADAAAPPPGTWDLVIASYVLGELPEPARAGAISRWLAATSGALVIVDVGSPDGFDAVRRARGALVAGGATIIAPCPHDGPCPMPADDWCHFGVRVPRSRLQRAVKSGERGFEDEKYSYAVAFNGSPVERASRVLRRPVRRSGQVRLRLCEPAGIRDTVVARREKEAYAIARRVRWGDTFQRDLRLR